MPALTPPNKVSSDVQALSMSTGLAAGIVKTRDSEACTRREVVTVAVKAEDFGRLKAAGGPHPDVINAALRHYVDLVREKGWRPRETSFGWQRGSVVHFPCAIAKDLAHEIRNLAGRFDGHTIEAVHLLLNAAAPSSNTIPQEILSSPTLRSSFASGVLGVLGLLVSRILGQPLIPQ